MLKILGIPRSTYYYQENGKKISDEQIKEWLLEEVTSDGYAYGYRKLTKQLRRKYRLIINKKKVCRLCKGLDILGPQRQKRISYSRKLERNRFIKASSQLWETDIKYGFIEGEQRFFFVCSFIDVYDRSLLIILV